MSAPRFLARSSPDGTVSILPLPEPGLRKKGQWHTPETLPLMPAFPAWQHILLAGADNAKHPAACPANSTREQHILLHARP